MFYTILAHLPDDCTWAISPSDFSAQLGVAWPRAEVHWDPEVLPERFREMRWQILHPPTADDTTQGTTLAGWVHDDERKITLHGPFIACVDFLLWYRALVPAIARLEFSDLLQTGNILVSSTTGRREILAAFAPTLPPRAWAVLEALDTPQGWCTLIQLIAALGLSYTPAQRTIPELDVALSILLEQALITDTDSRYKWAWDILPIRARLGRLLEPAVLERGITLSEVGRQAMIARRASRGSHR